MAKSLTEEKKYISPFWQEVDQALKENLILRDIMHSNMMLIRNKIKPFTDGGFVHKNRKKDYANTSD
jgi:hypothetical protein